MRREDRHIEETKRAALEVLRHNAHGPYRGLPRTAGWGYPEPYTRDLMIAALGILASGDRHLMASLRRVLETLAHNQSARGHISSLVHDPEDRGASDCTPLFLMALGMYRQVTGEADFLEEAAQKSLTWMDYQSPSDRVIVSQQPTSDWRDEQWVLGYGLFVNTVVYAYLRFFEQAGKAEILRERMGHFVVRGGFQRRHKYEGLVVPQQAHFAMWSYKVYRSDRFDLLGNSLAILSGLASPTRSDAIVSWVEAKCAALRETGWLALDLPPCLMPFIRPEDSDWLPRYEQYNQPGEYHNGGVWPFICGFYVAALVAAGHHRLAKRRLMALTELVRVAREKPVAFGFNEWFRAQDGTPQGQDWQTWSAAMYLYAAACVEQNKALFFCDLAPPARPHEPLGEPPQPVPPDGA
ncbi:MAG: amylo-alpha-1,6-glucosidase [Candidatus Hydrogenedentes bacterium]|nr:amylo-alpha-1,6-glucosidase [Candidatus Hydrogenedentota bacterium]